MKDDVTMNKTHGFWNGLSSKIGPLTEGDHRGLQALIGCILFLLVTGSLGQDRSVESKPDKDARMQWWRDARFGMFIHWGLYSIPAGEWKDEKNHAEWIRTTAQIPLEEYDKFQAQFNPVKFDAAEWVRFAREAGMKYITITTKHHDGFCLFDSKETDFDVMATPFKRDIMKELSDACHKEGIKICWYHSIMDWHHPDYLPRREWERDRPTTSADFKRFVQHLKRQLKELLTNYGEISVLWFDGEWESTWNNTYGKEIYDYVKSLQPNIIVNNRVGVGREGLEGFAKDGESLGDYGTPEQEIPATGLPGIDWETCMTMNDHWGFNKFDTNFKSSSDLLQKLADIASKGGNFLLNVGPTSLGLFPPTSISRLQDIGTWMKINGEAIYGTEASPFENLTWGRCTEKKIDGNTRLYFHVFQWPEDGNLIIPGIFNQPISSFLLSDSRKCPLAVSRNEDALVIEVPAKVPDLYNSVVVLDVKGKPDVSRPPKISAFDPIFVDSIAVTVTTDRDNTELHATLDGSIPTIDAPVVKGALVVGTTSIVSARAFRAGKPVSSVARMTYEKVSPRPAVIVQDVSPGIRYSYYEGDWDSLPRFEELTTGLKGILANIDFSPRKQVEHFGFSYSGFIRIPVTGVYSFSTDSDDGSRLYIGDTLVVDNDGLHGLTEKNGVLALSAGLHPLRVTFFEKTGGDDLKVYYRYQGEKKRPVPPEMLFHN